MVTELQGHLQTVAARRECCRYHEPRSGQGLPSPIRSRTFIAKADSIHGSPQSHRSPDMVLLSNDGVMSAMVLWETALSRSRTAPPDRPASGPPHITDIGASGSDHSRPGETVTSTTSSLHANVTWRRVWIHRAGDIHVSSIRRKTFYRPLSTP